VSQIKLSRELFMGLCVFDSNALNLGAHISNSMSQMGSNVTMNQLRSLTTSWQAKLYFLWRLPTAWWWGIRVEQLEAHQAIVSLPFNWYTKNPFRSIYFAALVGAGEFATGILALQALCGQPSVSMLVLHQEAEFVKKATERVYFHCQQGEQVRQVISDVVQSSAPKTIRMKAEATDGSGQVVARVYITWSFKRKR